MVLRGQQVLVTGAGGFIGSHLVEALVEEGCRVRALVHYNGRGSWGHLDDLDAAHRTSIEVVAGDVRDPFITSRAVQGCEVVFHLAALIAIPYSFIAPHSYVATNVEGTLNVLEACRAHSVARLVHTSTSEAYGTARYTPIDEEHPLQGQSPYAATKIGADKLVESYHRSYALPVATLRPFNAYGPRQSARAIVPTIVSQAIERRPVRLGALTPVRDFTYVTDTVAAFLAIAEADAAIGQVVNAGSGMGITIGDLARRVLQRVGAEDVGIEQDTSRLRPDCAEVQALVCNRQLAGELLGWTPRVALDQGLDRVIEYVSSHRSRFKPDVYAV